MKKIIKSRVFAFILGAITFGSIGVVAATYNAKQISYTPKDTSWKVNNVRDAIDELYNKANSSKVATQVATLTTQGATYTMQNDGYIIGTASSTYNEGGYWISYNDNNAGTDILSTSNYNDLTIHKVSLYASKDTIIYTRPSYGNYNLTVYEWK